MRGEDMNANGLLNADMATVGRWLRQGFDWWVEELRALVPGTTDSETVRGPTARYRADGSVVLANARGDKAAAPSHLPRSAPLVLPNDIVLERTIHVPAMRRADLRAYVALEAERLLPVPAETLLIDAMPVARAEAGALMPVRIAAVDRAVAERAIDAAMALGVTPSRVAVADDAAPNRLRYDFAPALRASGKLPPASLDRAAWWSLVALAFAANVGLLVWRDQQSVERLSAIVEAQQPAVTIHRAMLNRAQRQEQVAGMTAQRRTDHPVLADLAALTTALPEAAWVQHYAWDGRTVRISGYMRPAIDVVASLRRDPRLVNVRSATGDVQADAVIGQPFDVTADYRRTGK